MTLSIIIVNYKTPILTKRCVENIVKCINDNLKYEIIIIDNHSLDGLKHIIGDYLDNVKLIETNANIGFGAANNIGIRASTGDYILLVNSDVLIDSETVIIKCINNIQKDEFIGAIGCKMINTDGSIQNFTSTIARYRKLLDQNLLFAKIFPEKHFEKEAIMGAFMLIPSKVMKACGGFDSDFFMYSEEIDLCNRIRKLGYRVVYMDEISIFHENGGSTPNRDWANKQSKLSLALLFYKVHGFFGHLLYHVIVLMNMLTNSILMWFLNKQYRKDFFKDSAFYFNGFFKYLTIPILFRRKPGKGKRQLIAKP